MHDLLREVADARIETCLRRVGALRVLDTALRLDIAASVVRDHVPSGRFLLPSAPVAAPINEWAQTSAESGYWTEERSSTVHSSGAPDELIESLRGGTYEYVLMEDGYLRRIDRSLEAEVIASCGVGFSRLRELAQLDDVGPRIHSLAPRTEEALRIAGWNDLVRSVGAAGWDDDLDRRIQWGREGSEHTHLAWTRELLLEAGPPILQIVEPLRETDLRVLAAVTEIGSDAIPWTPEGLSVVAGLMRSEALDLRAARVDRVEVEVRSLLDDLDIVGEPSGLILASTDGVRSDRWDDPYDYHRVPARIVAGQLTLLDLFDFERDLPAIVDGEEWDVFDNRLSPLLVDLDIADSEAIDSIRFGDVAYHAFVLNGVVLDDFRLVGFGARG